MPEVRRDPRTLDNKVDICKWKEVSDRDKKYAPTRTPILPRDSICHQCDGYKVICIYYIDHFPVNKYQDLIR